MNHFLIVGQSSVAGQMATKAIRRQYPYAKISVTSSKPEFLHSEFSTIPNVDLSKTDSIDIIKRELKQPIDVLVFCPAFGMVGFPPQHSSDDEIRSCLAFSVEPVVKLMVDLKPRLTIGFSSFYWLHSLAVAYGAMAYAKYALELLAIKNPKSMRIIRAGLFESHSLRAICLLIQRSVQKETFAEAASLKAGWKASGTKFSEYFVHFAQTCEIGGLQNNLSFPYRGTVPEDLSYGLEQALEPDAMPIINVVGPSIWQESFLNHGPEFMLENASAMRAVQSLVESFTKAQDCVPVGN